MKTSNGIEYKDEVTIPTSLLLGLIHIIPNLALKVPKKDMGKSQQELNQVLEESSTFLKSVRIN